MSNISVKQPTITKKIANELVIDHTLAKRLVDFYNANLFIDGVVPRSKKGLRSSQILLGIGISKLSHLQDIAVDDAHKHCYLVNCILAAAGYVRATGSDAVLQTLINA